MGASTSIRMLYSEAFDWFKDNVDYELYLENFRQIDRDGDNTLSFSEIRLWVMTNAAKDPLWEIFTSGPVLAIAHKMAALHGDTVAVSAANVISISDFKTLLVHMYAISIMHIHFTVADNWDGSGGPVGMQDLNLSSFRLAVRTFVHQFAQEDLSDADIKVDFETIDSNQSDGVGFFEICNFCCKYIDDKLVVADEKKSRKSSTGGGGKFFGVLSENLRVRVAPSRVRGIHRELSIDEKNRSALAVLDERLKFHDVIAKALAAEEQINALKRQFRTIDDILSNPICCGYLQKFCQMEYNTENISFVLAVVEYKNLFAADKNVWMSPWMETDEVARIDEDYLDEALIASSYWSSLSDKEEVLAKLREIFDLYLEAHSTSEVCISEMQRERTTKRAKLLHLYGPEVFDEACIDPLKTLCKDVLPRFVTSDLFSAMIDQLVACRLLPEGPSLAVPVPNNDLLHSISADRFKSTKDNSTPDKKTVVIIEDCDFNLTEMMSCLVLYKEFEAFVVKCQLGDQFNCMRMVIVYEELVEKKALDAAIEHAWVMYKYFVAVGSALEVPVSETDRKQIMTHIAMPHLEAMTPLKKVVSRSLRMCLRVFKTTRNYSELCKRAKEEKLRMESRKDASKKGK